MRNAIISILFTDSKRMYSQLAKSCSVIYNAIRLSISNMHVDHAAKHAIYESLRKQTRMLSTLTEWRGVASSAFSLRYLSCIVNVHLKRCPYGSSMHFFNFNVLGFLSQFSSHGRLAQNSPILLNTMHGCMHIIS